MLTCIACSKQLNAGSLPEQEDDDTPATPPAPTKQTVKALTSQIKDIAIKASGAYKNCKPCSRSSNRNDDREHADSQGGDSVVEGYNFSYRRTASFDSTPRECGRETEIRLKQLSSGDRTPASVSGRTESVVFMEEEDEPKEWVAQVEPGVLITFVYLPQGGNNLKRIRFSREMFNKWQAQRWWAENYDKVMELYNVQRFDHRSVPLPNPPRSEDGNSKMESAEDSPPTPPLDKDRLPPRFQRPLDRGQYSSDSLEHSTGHSHHLCESGALNSTPKLSSVSATASVRSSWSKEDDHSGELSVSNASDMETEWVEQDEPGVYITIRALPGGTRELRRVRFSRERFGEMQARLWWEANRSRIQEQYLYP